ncbi:mannose-1-phosphate guanyltransferase [Calocera viscosa TUFC12733]|uniref:mannose-1-phosphate guanylyltransferase n=1 Tax=Calocera viscosa (strain TUFC12733) TaxID=1330018 RepID=A0A167MAV7_CALVF|nr:mannose-1-phosphate guanyltransferase [Calocera viscosa TUFC12733]
MSVSSKAIILIGGPSKGTRMRPLTLDTPKPLFPIAGRPLIWHHIRALSKVTGITEVFLIGFYEDAVFAPFLKDVSREFKNLSVKYMREYQALGTAGGLYHFRDTILRGTPGQIFVLHADICCSFPLKELQDFHGTHRGLVSMLGVRVPKETASKYGCIVPDTVTKQVLHYVEKPEGFISDLINGGVYLLEAQGFFDAIRVAMVRKSQQEMEDPYSYQDDLLRLEQDVVVPLCDDKKVFVYETLDFWRQIKTAGSALPATALYLHQYRTTNPEMLTKPKPGGPEIVEPVHIDATAQVDPTAKIGPSVSIGPGVVIGAGVRVKESIILDNVTVDKSAIVSNSIIAADCRIGPWARIEGEPLNPTSVVDSPTKETITILANNVTVARDVLVRCCIVLPQKTLTSNWWNEVLL